MPGVSCVASLNRDWTRVGSGRHFGRILGEFWAAFERILDGFWADFFENVGRILGRYEVFFCHVLFSTCQYSEILTVVLVRR